MDNLILAIIKVSEYVSDISKNHTEKRKFNVFK